MVLVLLLVVLTMMVGIMSTGSEDDANNLVMEVESQWHGKCMIVARLRYYQSEGGTFRTAYSIPGRGNGAGWGQNLHHHHLVRRAPGWPPLF